MFRLAGTCQKSSYTTTRWDYTFPGKMYRRTTLPVPAGAAFPSHVSDLSRMVFRLHSDRLAGLFTRFRALPSAGRGERTVWYQGEHVLREPAEGDGYILCRAKSDKLRRLSGNRPRAGNGNFLPGKNLRRNRLNARRVDDCKLLLLRPEVDSEEMIHIRRGGDHPSSYAAVASTMASATAAKSSSVVRSGSPTAIASWF